MHEEVEKFTGHFRKRADKEAEIWRKKDPNQCFIKKFLQEGA